MFFDSFTSVRFKLPANTLSLKYSKRHRLESSSYPHSLLSIVPQPTDTIAMSQQAPFQKEVTFSSYNQGQGEAYAAIRRDYDPSVYDAILHQHTSTGGQLTTLLDVGSGPGTSVRQLAPQFKHAIAIDPSAGMIAAARKLGGVSGDREPICFEVSSAEDLGSDLQRPVEDGSVDLITAATAAHWFDMDRFWPAAARVLKPGGSVAFWNSGGIRAHPSLPNSTAIQAVLDAAEGIELKPYMNRGNYLARGRYVDLPLPWTLAQPEPAFDEASFFRKEWDVDEPFYKGEVEVGLDGFEKIMGTSSPVARWREAHPDAVGTEEDLVRKIRRNIERLLHEAGVEKGKEVLKGAIQGALIVVKKKL